MENKKFNKGTFWNRISVTHLVIALLIVISTIPFLEGARRMMKVGEEFLSIKIQEEQISIADRVAKDLEIEMDKALSNLRETALLASFLDKSDLTDEAKKAEMNEIIRNAKTHAPWKLLVVYSAEGKAYGDDVNSYLPEDLMPIWEEILQHVVVTNFAKSDYIIHESNIYRIIGFRHEGLVSVVCMGLMDIKPLSDILHRYETQGRYLTLITGQSKPTVLFSSHPQLIPPGSLLNHPLGRTTSTLQSEYTVRYGEQDIRVFGVARPLKEFDGTLLIETDVKQALAIVRQMARDGVKGAATAGIIVFILAAVLGGFLSRPLRNLADITYRIAYERSFHYRLKVSGFKEFQQLKEAFNTLLDEILKYVRQVEEKAEENRRLFYDSIRMLTAAIDTKDPYTRGHSERVSQYAKIIATYMDLSPDDIEKVYLAGLLHDVGKIGIQDRILQKPAALTDEEYEIMKTHPEKGYKIMREIEQLNDVVPGMRYHHENWDGSGYPFGLKGEEIPLVARIVAVADSFDAMTTNRPYQRKMTIEKAVERVVMLSGKRFDPSVVQAFVRAYEEGALKIIEEGAMLEDELVATQEPSY